jgi:hypothetical protein
MLSIIKHLNTLKKNRKKIKHNEKQEKLKKSSYLLPNIYIYIYIYIYVDTLFKTTF